MVFLQRGQKKVVESTFSTREKEGGTELKKKDDVILEGGGVK